MRDSTYVVLALALCSLVVLLFALEPKKVWMMDLEDFRTLPVELRSALRRMLPDPVAIRQRWAMMTPDQKRVAIHQLGQFMPQARPPPSPAHMYPGVVSKPVPKEPEPVKAPELEAPVEPETPVEHEPFKKGFLDTVKKGKKKDSKNKKENEVITLGVVGTGVAEVHGTSGGDPGFLGSDD